MKKQFTTKVWQNKNGLVGWN